MSGKLTDILAKVIRKMIDWLSGDAALRKGVGKQLGFVFYIFLLLCSVITWSLIVESDLVKVKNNDKVIEELRISSQQRQLDYVGLNNRNKVERMLKNAGSKLEEPTDPPQRIIIRRDGK